MSVLAFKCQLSAALRELNEIGSRDAIAAWLAREGFKGRPRAACACPVSRYLTSKVHQIVIVNGQSVSFYVDGVGDFVRVETPLHVSNFITRFDNDQYPEVQE